MTNTTNPRPPAATAPQAALIDRYFAMWNTTDDAARRDVVAATWSPDATYVDPLVAAEGHDGLVAMVRAVHEQYPGHEFRLTGAVDAHHDRLRWEWQMTAPGDGAVLVNGVDFAVVAADGRLAQVTGFIEAPGGGS
jgi:hypothetical protein